MIGDIVYYNDKKYILTDDSEVDTHDTCHACAFYDSKNTKNRCTRTGTFGKNTRWAFLEEIDCIDSDIIFVEIKIQGVKKRLEL